MHNLNFTMFISYDIIPFLNDITGHYGKVGDGLNQVWPRGLPEISHTDLRKSENSAQALFSQRNLRDSFFLIMEMYWELVWHYDNQQITVKQR